MKKILLFLLLLLVQQGFSQLPDVRNFVVTADPNVSYTHGDRFDIEFDIRGNYGTREIQLWLYTGRKTSKPSNNNDLVWLIRWNREGDDVLNFPNYFTKATWNLWFPSGRGADPLPTIKNQTFTLLVQYQGSSRFLYYTVPGADADNDGVPDSQDQCPNDPGPPSNNGCPSKPELSIDLFGSSITSDCFSCDSGFSFIGSDRHFINSPTGIASINVLVRNSGNTTSSSSSVGIYISNNSTFESGSDIRIKGFSLGTISPGNVRFSSGALFIPDFNPSGFRGNTWLIIRVDDAENNDETNENNNVFALRFRVN